MRYAIWNVVFEDQLGTTPSELSGFFFVTPTSLAGYLPEGFDITANSKWAVTEITAEEFLALALKVNPTARLEEGKLEVDLPDNLKI